MIATVRPASLSRTPRCALKDHGCEYLELQPLSIEETGALVESVVGGEVDGETKHRLWDASRGLPLIVRELVLGGLERRFFITRAGLWLARSTARRRTAVGADWSTNRPPGQPRPSAARAGRVGRAAQLVAVGDQREERSGRPDCRGLLAAEQDGRRLELRLAHPLFGESVRGGMPATRGSTLQRRLADGLEATGLRRSGDLLRYAVAG